MKKNIFLIFLVLLTICISSCSKKQYEVKFVGFNNQLIETIIVSSKSELTYPVAPKVEGYTFTHWDKDVKKADSNLVITAIYEISKYNVKFYDFNGVVVKEEVVKHNDSASAPVLENVEGHKFVGWDKSYNYVKEDLKVRPLYNKLSFTVTFLDETGYVLDTQTVLYGEDAVSIDAPEKEGYKFVRWDETLTNIKQNIDVYPVYEELIYEVRFLDSYDNVLSVQSVKEGESAVSPSAPEIRYYTFKGWDQDFSSVNKNMTIKPIYTKQSNSFSNRTADYWLYIIANNYDIDEELLTQNEITEYNKQIVSDYSRTEVKDVLALNNSVTKEYVKKMLDEYTNINKYTVYNHETKTAISSTDKTNILNNRDYNNIPATVNVEFGIVTDFAWLRSYPTNNYSNDYSMDRFQETSLNVGEGVAIYHESLDKNWYFVQAENYNGWIEKKYVAKCDYETLVDFAKPDEKILVISDYVIIEGSHVRMGQVFPLVSSTTNTYTIKFPTRNSDGTLFLKDVTVNIGKDFNKGYLTYNYYNILTQAFKLLGIDYSWGDKDPLGRDCSSTMNAVYKCFGFMMPRNTSNQVKIPTYGSSCSGMTNEKMKTYKPGTLIYTSSHVMMYIGNDASGTPYLLHNTTSGTGACILQSLESYGNSKINGVLKLQ